MGFENLAPRIVVIGLGYVGLPLAIALARQFDVIGFDVDEGRISDLVRGCDRTGEVEHAELASTSLRLTAVDIECAGADIYIITVPTPVDHLNQPDLSAVLAATRQVATLIDPSRRPTVVYESTVYPGVTEDLCGPELERVGNLCRCRDFRLGYSPERINPGDRAHTVDKITKVVSGEDSEVVEQLVHLYSSVTSGEVFRAASIKAAEAAKAIENAQRDINIAFMNEVAQIVSRIGLSIWDVLDAARTKWNFVDFRPGLVGGHCIGVDPYYLSFLARQVGHEPDVILAGRNTNDRMGAWVADELHSRRGRAGSVLVLGLTFKPDVPDLRNSRARDVVERLEWLGHDVEVSDPLAAPDELEQLYPGKLMLPGSEKAYDLVIAAVPHASYHAMSDEEVVRLLARGGTLADLSGMWRDRHLGGNVDRWSM